MERFLLLLFWLLAASFRLHRRHTPSRSDSGDLVDAHDEDVHLARRQSA